MFHITTLMFSWHVSHYHINVCISCLKWLHWCLDLLFHMTTLMFVFNVSHYHIDVCIDCFTLPHWCFYLMFTITTMMFVFNVLYNQKDNKYIYSQFIGHCWLILSKKQSIFFPISALKEGRYEKHKKITALKEGRYEKYNKIAALQDPKTDIC